jgi:hypothetical protein
LLGVLFAQLVRKLLDLGQLGVTNAGIPVNRDVVRAEVQRHGNGSENADRLATGPLLCRQQVARAVHTNELAFIDQALANGGIQIGKHGGAL